ncbi:MAG: hypothetical protein LCH32_08865 [Bacteroidetes bacterium]|nr:hypothetical protein [Bacteroidota bacterium]
MKDDFASREAPVCRQGRLKSSSFKAKKTLAKFYEGLIFLVLLCQDKRTKTIFKKYFLSVD